MGHPYVHAVHPHLLQGLCKEVACHRPSGPRVCNIGGMNTALLRVLERERAAGLRGLAGTRVEAMVPITQHLVDVLVARVGAARKMGGLNVTLRAANEIGVAVVKSVFGFDTRLAIHLRIRGPSRSRLGSAALLARGASVDDMECHQPTRHRHGAGAAGRGDRARWGGNRSPDARVTGRRCGSAGARADRRIRGGRGRAPCPRRGRCAGGGRPPRGASGTAEDRRAWAPIQRSVADLPGAGALLTEFRGARLSGRVAVSEALANDAVSAALEAARAGGSGEHTAPPTSRPGRRRRPASRCRNAGRVGSTGRCSFPERPDRARARYSDRLI